MNSPLERFSGMAKNTLATAAIGTAFTLGASSENITYSAPAQPAPQELSGICFGYTPADASEAPLVVGRTIHRLFESGIFYEVVQTGDLEPAFAAGATIFSEEQNDAKALRFLESDCNFSLSAPIEPQGLNN